MELGKSFNKAEDMRLIADYKGDPLDTADALWVVEQAAGFVGAVQDSFFS